jgi:hypothetical protein
MKPFLQLGMILGALLLPLPNYGLSRPIGRDVEFGKGYDETKAENLRKFVRDEKFKFLGGYVSYWPPEISTRLSFEGETQSLNDFFTELRKLRGFTMRLVLYKGRSDELRNDSTWQLDYSQARPDEVVVYLNLNSTSLDFGKLKLPEWPEITSK